MPDKLTISINLVKATSIEQFKLPSGQRHMYLHYYQLNKDGELLCRWIEASTDAKALERLIQAGRIFLPEDS